MTFPLHVVVELATWADSAASSEGLNKLEHHLADHPEISLTLVTRGAFQPALAQLSELGRIHPRHFISDAGTAIFHREGAERWSEDQAYLTWAEADWSARALERFVAWGIPQGMRRVLGEYSSRHVILEPVEQKEGTVAVEETLAGILNTGLQAEVIPIGSLIEIVPKGVDRSTAVMFLHQSSRVPEPLMVCGSSELNLNLFQQATFPVLMADSPLDFETPGVPRERIYRTTTPGPVGVLEALLQVEFTQSTVSKRR